MSDVGTMYANAKALHELLQESRAENEKLQDENERLRSCLSDSAENSKQIMHEAHVQEEENAKLRELVRELWSCAASLAEDSVYHIEGAVCGCGINCVVNGEDCSAYKLRDRMRELGVETDG